MTIYSFTSPFNANMALNFVGKSKEKIVSVVSSIGVNHYFVGTTMI